MRKLLVKRQRGGILALLTTGLVTMFTAAGLAVDMGYVFYFKNQLQNAADAAALAGAHGLLVDPGNLSSGGQAKQLAIEFAGRNMAGGDPVDLQVGEISFPDGNHIRVGITRPAATFFMRLVGITQVNVQVRSAAAVIPATGGGGMRPFALLDQFGHGSLCVSPNDEMINDPPHGEFKDYPHQWNGFTVASDHYKSPYDPAFDGWDLSREGDCDNVTGLIAPRDVDGQRMAIKVDKWLTPGNFGPAALGATGADIYENNIIYGYDGLIRIGDILNTEPGNMIGPTGTGIDGLIAQDPGAQIVRTSSGNWAVISDSFSMNESPRIVPIPMYSVLYAPDEGRSDFRVDNIGSFFIEESRGQYVYGYFIQSRIKNAQPGDVPRDPSNQTVSGGGRLLGTVQLVDPD